MKQVKLNTTFMSFPLTNLADFDSGKALCAIERSIDEWREHQLQHRGILWSIRGMTVHDNTMIVVMEATRP